MKRHQTKSTLEYHAKAMKGEDMLTSHICQDPHLTERKPQRESKIEGIKFVVIRENTSVPGLAKAPDVYVGGHCCCQDNRGVTGHSDTDAVDVFYRTKPLERCSNNDHIVRSLYSSSASLP
ncbi:hypothetical protein ACRRTK_014523 [Alexandromys fortis]